MTGDIKLYCYNVCPFAQRAHIAFEKTKVPYQYVELNPYKNRENGEWKRINPAGKVPAITVNDEKPGLPESRQCLEFINEVSKGKLFSDDPLLNGHMRVFCDLVVDAKIIPSWYGFLMGKKPAEDMTNAWKEFTTKLDLEKGPFAFGQNDIGFIDMMVAPFMIRGPVLERWRDYKIREILSGEEQKKYIRWENAVMDHPAVKACLHDINMIVEAYESYAKGNPTVTK